LTAFKIYCKIKFKIKLREKVDPFWIIIIALLKITPDILVYPLKLGGVVQKVPLPIGARKQYTFAVKWVVKLMKEKHGSYTVDILLIP
jgi:ribosomal protein S7